jgi:hypothetical protein
VPAHSVMQRQLFDGVAAATGALGSARRHSPKRPRVPQASAAGAARSRR